MVDSRTNIKLIVGNIYRLPKETNLDYDTFMEELMTVLQQLNLNTANISLFGDFNIDLLRIKERPKINEFFDLMVSHSFIPNIALHTRFSRNSATLIDNVFCKISRNFSKTSSGILTNNISDRQAYFICFDYLAKTNITPKFVKKPKFNENTFREF